jgi:phospholipid/cholesterol/gamma-HCH transport system substrate-binding protein
MESKVNYVLVGIFVLVLSTALIAGGLWLTSGKFYRKNYDVYQAYMTESVAGLNLNAPVKYRGVDVGRVRKIALAPQNIEVVELTLDIERGTQIKEDTLAVLQTQGLTGIAYVELSSGRQASAPLMARPGEPYPVIKSGTSLMSRLESEATTLLDSANRTAANLNAVLDDENRRNFKKTLSELEVVVRTLAARSATIDAGLASAARTMENTARVTERLPQLVARVERSADAFDRMADRVGGAGTSATVTLDATRADLQRFTGETLPEVRDLVAEMRELTTTLQRVGSEIERNPAVLVYGKKPARRGPGE